MKPIYLGEGYYWSQIGLVYREAICTKRKNLLVKHNILTQCDKAAWACTEAIVS